MAKKLVYNYTFTPGVANVGNVVIKGNYPSKVWQLVTVTGTGGLYPHTFVRDEYASSTGAIEIITGGSGDLTMSKLPPLLMRILVFSLSLRQRTII